MQFLAGHPRSLPLALIGAAVLTLTGGGDLKATEAPVDISFRTADGGEVHAHLYGSGESAVVLAHGKVFDKESWQPLAELLAQQGVGVLALDFRGYGQSTSGTDADRLDLDVLGAVDYLEQRGVRIISLLGASMGGWAVGNAATQCAPGQLHKVILLAPVPIEEPQEMKAEAFVYVAAEDERGIERIRAQFERAPQPKRLEILSGSAHAQHIFKTDQADELRRIILSELTR